MAICSVANYSEISRDLEKLGTVWENGEFLVKNHDI